MTPGQVFLQYSIDKLLQLEGRIAHCLSRLSADQVWGRGGENENAIGNLVLHLCGNVRQWIGVGVGRLDNVRDRDAEFAARSGLGPEELQVRLSEECRQAAEILREFPEERLSEQVRIQGYDVTVLEAVYHVVEHFSQHTGQIILLTKHMTGEDLGFYGHIGASSHSGKTP